MPEPTWTETQVVTKRAVPDGLWTQCPECAETIFRKSLEANLMVCPKCDHHIHGTESTRFHIGLRTRITMSRGPQYRRFHSS